MVKEFLSQRGVRYEERDVSANAVYARELGKSGQMGVPVTVIDNQLVIGFDRPALERLIAQSQSAQRPSFGAAVADAAKIAAKMGGGKATGAYVGKVRPGSAAEKLGLAPGDIIVEMNKNNINNAADMERVVSGFSEGSRIWITFLRDNKKVAAEGIY